MDPNAQSNDSIILHPKFTPNTCASATTAESQVMESHGNPSQPHRTTHGADTNVHKSSHKQGRKHFASQTGLNYVAVGVHGKENISGRLHVGRKPVPQYAATVALGNEGGCHGKALCGGEHGLAGLQTRKDSAPRGRRPCSQFSSIGSPTSGRRVQSMPDPNLTAAHDNFKDRSHRRHCAPRVSEPQETKASGLKQVVPKGYTDTVLQLSDHLSVSKEVNTGGLRSGYARQTFNPQFLASTKDEDLITSSKARHEKLHSSQRHRQAENYRVMAEGEASSKPGKRVHPNRNESVKDVVDSKFAPSASVPQLHTQESRAKYQHALNQAHKDVGSLRQIATYHKIRSQNTSLALTDYLYECKDTPPDLRPQTAR
jgi:hypothetical protein